MLDRSHRQIAHAGLYAHNGQPKQFGHRIEKKRQQNPPLQEGIADEPDESRAGDRLEHHRARGEQIIGDHHDARDARDSAGRPSDARAA